MYPLRNGEWYPVGVIEEVISEVAGNRGGKY